MSLIKAGGRHTTFNYPASLVLIRSDQDPDLSRQPHNHAIHLKALISAKDKAYLPVPEKAQQLHRKDPQARANSHDEVIE